MDDPQHIKQDVVAVYDRAAPTYDRVGARFFSHFGRLLVDRLGITEGARVLDVATGRGAMLFPAAERAGSTGCVVGIDLAPTMARHTAEEIAQRGLQNSRIALMDGDHIGFAPGSFDYVLCGSALFFLNYAQALPDFKRILKPAGTFAAWVSLSTNDPEDIARWQWLSELTQSLVTAGLQAPKSWTLAERLNRPGKLALVLQRAGFDEIRISRESAELHFADEDEWWGWQWSQAPRFLLEAMTPEMLYTFKSEALAKVRAMRGPDKTSIPIKIDALFVTGRRS